MFIALVTFVAVVLVVAVIVLAIHRRNQRECVRANGELVNEFTRLR